MARQNLQYLLVPDAGSARGLRRILAERSARSGMVVGTWSELMKWACRAYLIPETTDDNDSGFRKALEEIEDDQLRLIDVVEANPRVICSGGAGTGKTMLALELAKRWGASGMETALTCHSPWLKRFLERNAVPGLIVSLMDSLHVAAKRASIERELYLNVDIGRGGGMIGGCVFLPLSGKPSQYLCPVSE